MRTIANVNRISEWCMCNNCYLQLIFYVQISSIIILYLIAA